MQFSSAHMLQTVGMPESVPIGQSLWQGKQSPDELKSLKAGDAYTFDSQFQQDPSPMTGGMFKDQFWRSYDLLPQMDIIRIYGDTAQKKGEHNDYTVFQCWGRAIDRKNIYLMDLIRGKWEAPQIESKLVEFWNKHKPTIHAPIGASVVKIEDKSSGSSLIQSIQQDTAIPVEGIPRFTDKVVRAYGVVKYVSAGYVHLPADAPWVSDYKEEFRLFTPLMTHAHDDQIDPTMDAIEDLLIFNGPDYTEDNIG